MVVCTPPLCAVGEVFSCPAEANGCPGGCGTTCATPTPTPSETPMVVCTPPLCAAGEVFSCPAEANGCPGGCGTTCATPTPTATGGPTQFVDNGNGTVTDSVSGLTWEKKCEDCGGLHDVGSTLVWSCRDGVSVSTMHPCQPSQEASDACFAGATIDAAGDATVGCARCDELSFGFLCTSMTIWEWLVAVNAEGLGGHTDWTLPNQDQLASLLQPGDPTPTVDPLLGPSASAYWSSTTQAADATLARVVLFASDEPPFDVKVSSKNAVRAVRGGTAQ
jgi:hypothetical protein